MLDVQLLRTRLDFVAERLATRGMSLDVAAFQALEDERKSRQTRTQELQSRRNTLSKQVGQLKGKGEDASAVLAEVGGIGDVMVLGNDGDVFVGQVAVIQAVTNGQHRGLLRWSHWNGAV